MSVEMLRAFFGWCTLVNVGVLVFWVVFLLLGRNWVYRMHGRMFGLEPATLGAIHYGAIALYKLGVILFNVVPYVALGIVG